MNQLFPTGLVCLHCGEPRRMDGTAVLCEKCRRELEDMRVPAHSCKRCLSRLEKDGTCKFCKGDGLGDIACAYAPYRYQAVARSLCHQLKFNDTDDALFDMCRDMADAWPDRAYDVMVPVPLHRLRQRVRGCNQAMKLCEGVSRLTGVQVLDALVRTRHTRPQAALQREADRKNNVENAFAMQAGCDVKGKRVLLVDDIRTSGSTARACARVLLQHGARQVALLTYGVVWHYKGKKDGSLAGKNGLAAWLRGRRKTEK